MHFLFKLGVQLLNLERGFLLLAVQVGPESL